MVPWLGPSLELAAAGLFLWAWLVAAGLWRGAPALLAVSLGTLFVEGWARRWHETARATKMVREPSR